MKNPLNKSLKKEFTDNLARYLALALVMIVMIATVSGFFSVAYSCLLYTSPSPRDRQKSRMPSSA